MAEGRQNKTSYKETMKRARQKCKTQTRFLKKNITYNSQNQKSTKRDKNPKANEKFGKSNVPCETNGKKTTKNPSGIKEI